MRLQKNGYKYVIEEREGDVARLSGTNNHGSTTHEVVIILVSKTERVFPNGAVVPAGTEYLPSNNQWGVYGWTYQNEEDAKEGFKYRVKHRKAAVA